MAIGMLPTTRRTPYRGAPTATLERPAARRCSPPASASARCASSSRAPAAATSFAREVLVRRFLPLARQLAARYRRGARAATRTSSRSPAWRWSRRSTASSWAATRLHQLCGSHHPRRAQAPLPRHRLDLHVPRSLQERAARVDRRRDRAEDAAGPLAVHRGGRRAVWLTEEEVVEALAVGQRGPDALARRAPARWRGRRRRRFGETLGDQDPGLRLGGGRRGRPRRDDRAAPARAARSCGCASWRSSPRRRSGSRVGLSQMHISRLLRRTLARLREELQT